MLKEEKNEKRPGFRGFLDQNYGILAGIFGLLAVASFFLPFIEYSTKINGVKTYYSVDLLDVFHHNYPYGWTIHMAVILITLGMLFSFFSFLFKEADVIAGFCYLLGLILSIFLREIFTNNNIEGFRSASFTRGMASIFFFLAVATSICFIWSTKKVKFSISSICEDGLLVAAAFALNFAKVDLIAGAGSFNLQMLPLFFIALRRGAFHSFLCGGIVYGLISCFTDGWGFQTYPFDYLIGFGSIAILSLFRKFIISKGQTKINFKGELFLAIGCILSTFVRLVGSTLSSMIIYKYDFVNALAYNLTYIPLSGVVAMLILMVGYKFIINFNRHFPTTKRITD